MIKDTARSSDSTIILLVNRTEITQPSIYTLKNAIFLCLKQTSGEIVFISQFSLSGLHLIKALSNLLKLSLFYRLLFTN